MKRSFLFVFVCLISIHKFSIAQEGMSELAGIRFAYEANSERKIDGLNAEISYDQWEVRAPFFYHKIDDWTMAAGFRYQATNLDISNSSIYPLNESQLHSLDLALFLSKKKDETLDWLLLFNPTLAGDFENTGSDAFNYLTIAGARWKQSETLQWIFGAVYTTGIGDDLFLPAVGFIWKPSERSNFVFAGPIIRYKYELNDSLALNLGGQFSGNRWHTEANYGGSLEKRDFRFRSYRTFANLEFKFAEKHSVFVGGGVDFASELELESPTIRDERDTESGANFEIGYNFRF